MLVISRKQNEVFFVGDAKIRITKLSRKRVILRIDADRSIAVDREEVRERQQQQQKQKQTERMYNE